MNDADREEEFMRALRGMQQASIGVAAAMRAVGSAASMLGMCLTDMRQSIAGFDPDGDAAAEIAEAAIGRAAKQ